MENRIDEVTIKSEMGEMGDTELGVRSNKLLQCCERLSFAK